MEQEKLVQNVAAGNFSMLIAQKLTPNARDFLEHGFQQSQYANSNCSN
jgi:hypothetical protein